MKRVLTISLAMLFVAALAVTSPAAGTGAPRAGAASPQPEAGREREKAYSFSFSGFFKADIAYDKAGIYPGNFALWVPPEAASKDDMINTTARETRLGIDFQWTEKGYRTDAKLEVDFYGLGASPATYNSMENKAAPMLRHAYLKIAKGRWSVLAGQTSDVISPLFPRTVNYTVGWAQGNIGYRRPQFRISAFTDVGGSFRIKACIAAARTLGNDLDSILVGGEAVNGDGIDDGTESALPTIQGRVGFDAKWGTRGSASIGFSGHSGREEYNYAAAEGEQEKRTNDSWSFNIDARIALSERLLLSGEFFTGKNLGAYFGGILQSTNRLRSEISAMGGWGMLTLKPRNRVTFNAGYCWDDPDDADLRALEGESWTYMSKNSVIFGNIMYGVTSNVTAMLELSQLKTSYASPGADGWEGSGLEGDIDALRVQFALKAAIE